METKQDSMEGERYISRETVHLWCCAGHLVRDDPERDHREAAAQHGARCRARPEAHAHAQDLLPHRLLRGDAFALAQMPRQVGVPVLGQCQGCRFQVYLGEIENMQGSFSDVCRGRNMNFEGQNINLQDALFVDNITGSVDFFCVDKNVLAREMSGFECRKLKWKLCALSIKSPVFHILSHPSLRNLAKHLSKLSHPSLKTFVIYLPECCHSSLRTLSLISQNLAIHFWDQSHLSSRTEPSISEY